MCSTLFRQHKLEEALLFSGQFAEALQALVDWLYRVEPQLTEDQPVHGDMDLVSNLMDAHKVGSDEEKVKNRIITRNVCIVDSCRLSRKNWGRGPAAFRL